jgi:hypothetical protein
LSPIKINNELIQKELIFDEKKDNLIKENEIQKELIFDEKKDNLIKENEIQKENIKVEEEEDINEFSMDSNIYNEIKNNQSEDSSFDIENDLLENSFYDNYKNK